ncbi:hypothetical protein ACA910_002392 [Epithemia clementina (nom. ined.)]
MSSTQDASEADDHCGDETLAANATNDDAFDIEGIINRRLRQAQKLDDDQIRDIFNKLPHKPSNRSRRGKWHVHLANFIRMELMRATDIHRHYRLRRKSHDNVKALFAKLDKAYQRTELTSPTSDHAKEPIVLDSEESENEDTATSKQQASAPKQSTYNNSLPNHAQQPESRRDVVVANPVSHNHLPGTNGSRMGRGMHATLPAWKTRNSAPGSDGGESGGGGGGGGGAPQAAPLMSERFSKPPSTFEETNNSQRKRDHNNYDDNHEDQDKGPNSKRHQTNSTGRNPLSTRNDNFRRVSETSTATAPTNAASSSATMAVDTDTIPKKRGSFTGATNDSSSSRKLPMPPPAVRHGSFGSVSSGGSTNNNSNNNNPLANHFSNNAPHLTTQGGGGQWARPTRRSPSVSPPRDTFGRSSSGSPPSFNGSPANKNGSRSSNGWGANSSAVATRQPLASGWGANSAAAATRQPLPSGWGAKSPAAAATRQPLSSGWGAKSAAAATRQPLSSGWGAKGAAAATRQPLSSGWGASNKGTTVTTSGSGSNRPSGSSPVSGFGSKPTPVLAITDSNSNFKATWGSKKLASVSNADAPAAPFMGDQSNAHRTATAGVASAEAQPVRPTGDAKKVGGASTVSAVATITANGSTAPLVNTGWGAKITGVTTASHHAVAATANNDSETQGGDARSTVATAAESTTGLAANASTTGQAAVISVQSKNGAVSRLRSDASSTPSTEVTSTVQMTSSGWGKKTASTLAGSSENGAFTDTATRPSVTTSPPLLTQFSKLATPNPEISTDKNWARERVSRGIGKAGDKERAATSITLPANKDVERPKANGIRGSSASHTDSTDTKCEMLLENYGVLKQTRSPLFIRFAEEDVNVPYSQYAVSKRPTGRNSMNVNVTPKHVPFDQFQKTVERLQKWEPFWSIDWIAQVAATNVVDGTTDPAAASAAHLDVWLEDPFWSPRGKKAILDVGNSAWGKAKNEKELRSNEMRLLLMALPEKPSKKRSDTHLWPKGTFVQITTTDTGKTKLVRITQRKQQSHDLTEWKGNCNILDLTTYVVDPSQPFKIDLLTHDRDPYIFILGLCHYRTCQTLYETLTCYGSPHALQMLSEEHAKAKAKSLATSLTILDDDGLENGNSLGKIIFSLRDSTTKLLQGTPVRGKDCVHFQCFDLLPFLHGNSFPSGQRWRCRGCEMFLSPFDLEVCGLTASLIKDHQKKNDAKIDRVEFLSNGTCVLMPERKPKYSQRKGGKQVKNAATNESKVKLVYDDVIEIL